MESSEMNRITAERLGYKFPGHPEHALRTQGWVTPDKFCINPDGDMNFIHSVLTKPDACSWRLIADLQHEITRLENENDRLTQENLDMARELGAKSEPDEPFCR